MTPAASLDLELLVSTFFRISHNLRVIPKRVLVVTCKHPSNHLLGTFHLAGKTCIDETAKRDWLKGPLTRLPDQVQSLNMMISAFIPCPPACERLEELECIFWMYELAIPLSRGGLCIPYLPCLPVMR